MACSLVQQVTDEYGYDVSARRIAAADQRMEYRIQNRLKQNDKSQWPLHITPHEHAGTNLTSLMSTDLYSQFFG
jgi:hypothetical protein